MLYETVRFSLGTQASMTYIYLIQYKEADKRRENDSREAVAHKVAWSAVEKKYHKNDKEHWVEK